MEKQKELTGVLFTNAKKQTEKHPDLTGRCMIDGKEYYMSAWRKKSQGGNEYTSLAFKPVDLIPQLYNVLQL